VGLARLAPGRGEGRSGKTKICLSEASLFLFSGGQDPSATAGTALDFWYFLSRKSTKQKRR